MSRENSDAESVLIQNRGLPSLRRPVLSRVWNRCLYTSLTVGIATMLLLAGQLQPDSAGYGTHRQLGLPPCSMKLFYGIRCPACGMTTSWAHFVRGEFGPALRANLGGTLLAVLAVFSLPMTTWKLLMGDGMSNREAWVAVVGLFLAIAASMVDWTLKL